MRPAASNCISKKEKKFLNHPAFFFFVRDVNDRASPTPRLFLARRVCFSPCSMVIRLSKQQSSTLSVYIPTFHRRTRQKGLLKSLEIGEKKACTGATNRIFQPDSINTDDTAKKTCWRCFSPHCQRPRWLPKPHLSSPLARLVPKTLPCTPNVLAAYAKLSGNRSCSIFVPKKTVLFKERLDKWILL